MNIVSSAGLSQWIRRMGDADGPEVQVKPSACVQSCEYPRIWKNILADFEFKELKPLRLVCRHWNKIVVHQTSFLDQAELHCFTSASQVEVLHVTQVPWRNVICKNFGIAIRVFAKVAFFITTLDLNGVLQLKYLFPVLAHSPNVKTLKLSLVDANPNTLSFGAVSKDAYVKLPLIIARIQKLKVTGGGLFRKITETLVPKELKHIRHLEINDSLLNSSSLYKLLDASSKSLEALIIRDSDVNMKWLKNIGFVGFPLLETFALTNCWLLDENANKDIITIVYGDKRNNKDFVQALNSIFSTSKTGIKHLELDCKTSILEPSYEDILQDLCSLETLSISLGDEHMTILRRVPLNVSFHVGNLGRMENLSSLCLRQPSADDPLPIHECPRIPDCSFDEETKEIAYFNRLNLAYLFLNITDAAYYQKFTNLTLDGIACDAGTLNMIIPLCKNLRNLFINPMFKSSSSITDEFMLNTCLTVTKLVTLTIRNSCVLTENGLANLTNLRKLKELGFIKCCRLTDTAICKYVPYLPSIQVIDFNENPKISPKGIRQLMRIATTELGKTILQKTYFHQQSSSSKRKVQETI